MKFFTVSIAALALALPAIAESAAPSAAGSAPAASGAAAPSGGSAAASASGGAASGGASGAAPSASGGAASGGASGAAPSASGGAASASGGGASPSASASASGSAGGSTPSGGSGGGSGGGGGGFGLPDLSKLTQCASKQVFATVPKAGCSSPLDKKCICTDNFLNQATAAILGDCPPKDAVGALEVMHEMCPDMPLPDLSKLPECAVGCVTSTLTKNGCKGPTDNECLCQPSFALNAAGCLLSQCQLEGTGEAVGLLFNICRPSDKEGCNATGLWRLTDLSCIIPGIGKRDRQGTPAAQQYRRLLE